MPQCPKKSSDYYKLYIYKPKFLFRGTRLYKYSVHLKRSIKVEKDKHQYPEQILKNDMNLYWNVFLANNES